MTAETAGVSRMRPGTSSRGFVVCGPEEGASAAMKARGEDKAGDENGPG